jgi:hypothetical protein
VQLVCITTEVNVTDPIVSAARRFIGGGFATLRSVVEAVPAQALNWRPAGEETNSIAVLVTHAAYATRMLVAMALGLPLPPRDRPAEFAARAEDGESLLRLVDGLSGECLAALDRAGPVDWGALRERRRDSGEVVQIPAAEALFYAVEHLRGHADEASLTRHLWLARSQ